MEIKGGKENLERLILKQIASFFLDGLNGIEESIDNALHRLNLANQVSVNKYYVSGEVTFFDPRHSGQYCIFLWYLSNELFKNGFKEGAEKVYLLNKYLHSVDWYFEIELPNSIGVEHPVGSILGRAKYGEKLFLYQAVTIGGNRKGDIIERPIIGDNVVCYANTTILGNCNIGNNVMISAGTLLLNENVPDNTIVFKNGKMKTLTIEEMEERMKYFFR